MNWFRMLSVRSRRAMWKTHPIRMRVLSCPPLSALLERAEQFLIAGADDIEEVRAMLDDTSVRPLPEHPATLPVAAILQFRRRNTAGVAAILQSDNSSARSKPSPALLPIAPLSNSCLAVGRRRAQQIMAPCITGHIGANGLADRDSLIATPAQRRRDSGAVQKDRLERPQLLVESPVQVLTQEFENLHARVTLGPGRVTVTFEQPQQAFEKTAGSLHGHRQQLRLLRAPGTACSCLSARVSPTTQTHGFGSAIWRQPKVSG